MKSIINWFIRFIVWILLYYLIIYKLCDLIFDTKILNSNNFNLDILYTAIIISFLNSFYKKLLSFKNIKYHIIQAVVIGVGPISIWTINIFIDIINLSIKIVNAPQINNIKILVHDRYCNSCGGEHINNFGIFYIISAIISTIIYLIWIYSCLDNQGNNYYSYHDDDCE